MPVDILTLPLIGREGTLRAVSSPRTGCDSISASFEAKNEGQERQDMATTFIMLTRLAHGALRSPETLEKLEQEVKARIDQEVGKGVEWLANYAILGPYDYLDIFRAPDVETAMKVATIVRGMGRGTNSDHLN